MLVYDLTSCRWLPETRRSFTPALYLENIILVYALWFNGEVNVIGVKYARLPDPRDAAGGGSCERVISKGH